MGKGSSDMLLREITIWLYQRRNHYFLFMVGELKLLSPKMVGGVFFGVKPQKTHPHPPLPGKAEQLQNKNKNI